MEPFVIGVHGHAEIPKPAERAILDVVVTSSGTNKASVSDEVLTTAKHIESLLRELSPDDETQEEKDASPLAHWSKTTMTATSYVPYRRSPGPEPSRKYAASIGFDIRFKDFKALGGFGAKLSALSHVEVNRIDWILTKETEKSFRSQLRKEAARDALQKAQDYTEVMGYTNLRPVELKEDRYATYSSDNHVGALQYQELNVRAVGAERRRARSAGSGEDRDESPLEFKPEEVRMSMDILVKFHADLGG